MPMPKTTISSRSMNHFNEGLRLEEQLHNALGDLDANFGDDLEGMLTWINPNEPKSNHQLRPPIMRIKSAIKTLVNIRIVQEPFLDLLRHYMIYQTRKHFFLNFQSLMSFKDIQKLERYYEFPLRFLELFGPGEWAEEINGLRNYLIFHHPTLKQNVRLRFEQLMLEDDFEMACKIYDWLCQAEGGFLTHLLVDVVLMKVRLFSAKTMGTVWTKRFVIMETYNQFISNYWTVFSGMLQCPEDDHEITNEIYKCFEEEFIKIRTKQVFDLFVTEYPISKPTLLELRTVLKSPTKYTQLITEFLCQFEAKRLKPSVTTTEILLSYVKAIKSILIVDVSFRYFQLLTNFVRPYLMERRDTVVTFLYAMLGLDASEIKGASQTPAHMNIALQLSAELKDSHQPISTSMLGSSCQNTVERSPVLNPNAPICQQVINYYLQWTPEPSDSIQASNDDALMSKGLFDIVVELFDSRDVIIAEFLALFTEKLLNLKGYKLEHNWVRSLKILKQKFDFKKYPNAQDVSNVNNIDVMLRDIKHSEELCLDMHNLPNLNPNIIPKIISYLFWGAASDFSYHSQDVKLPLDLDNDLKKYKEAYSEIKKGRKLRLHQEQSTVEINLKFADGRTSVYKVPMEEAIILSCFSSPTDSTGLSQKEISEKTSMEKLHVDRILSFWVNSSVLFYDDKADVYKALEHRDHMKNMTSIKHAGTEGSAHRPKHDTSGAMDLQQKEFIDSMQKIWPFIKGMLTNLGSMKVEKIHSFLKMAVPKELRFTATVSQLESYLSILVDENKLVSSPNGAFKLVK